MTNSNNKGLQPLVLTIQRNAAILNNNVAFASACRWQAHCVIQGVKTPCYSCFKFFKNWIASAELRNDEFFKKNFALFRV